MNQKITNHLFLYVLIFPLLVSACNPPQDDSDIAETISGDLTLATATTIIVSPTPLPTPTPTLSPTPTEFAEPDTILDCIPDELQDELQFYEAIDSLVPSMWEMDNYRYHAIYRYKSGEDYASDELALEIFGENRGLLTEEDPVSEFSLVRHNQSHVIITDLHTMTQDEYLQRDDSVWMRANDGAGWIAFEPGSVEVFNLTDLLIPPYVTFLVAGGGGLSPGIRAERPFMSKMETINGIDTIHRCWKPNGSNDNGKNPIDGYLIHTDSLYTFLADTEVHLWTADEDTQLVRLVITGRHIGERWFDIGQISHDTPYDFLLWIDMSDIGSVSEITPPSPEEILFEVNIEDPGRKVVNDTPYNQFPVPTGAVEIGSSEDQLEDPLYDLDDSGLTSELVATFIPREFMVVENSFNYGVMEVKFGSNWSIAPQDRTPVYETEMDWMELLTFYTEELGSLGWTLDDVIVQAGNPKYYIFYRRGNETLPIILESGIEKATRMTTILPPEDELNKAILTGWDTYNEANSDILRNTVTDIAFDQSGNTWIGSESTGGWSTISSDGTTRESEEIFGGISVFDGEDWITYTETTSGLVGDSISSIAVDGEGQIWVSTKDTINLYDGEEWTHYSEQDHGLSGLGELVFDRKGNLWISSWGGVLSSFNGKDWESYEHLYYILGFDVDEQGRPWIGTNGGGIYSLDDGTWTEHVIPNGESGNFNQYDIENISIDGSGRLWVVSDSEGLRVLEDDKWETYDYQDSGFNIDSVKDFVIDNQDRIWLVTWQGGVYMLGTDRTWTEFTPYGIGISIYAPEVIDVDQQGRIWIGSQEGVAVFSPPVP